MVFRTELSVSPSSFTIDHSSKIMTIGSCFANVIGEKLNSHKFDVSINPFGVLFNPISIFKALQACAQKENVFLGSVVENNSIWYNYDLHSDISALNKDDLLIKISDILSHASERLRSADILTITLGTSFVYKRIETNEVVANCHKIPAGRFTKEILLPEIIFKEFSKTYELLKKANPAIKIILTVSPVRHIKDGIEQNAVSKSILRVASNLIQTSIPDVHYFPAYEIMMDDLRDYRFYKEDMIHPSEVAENYIWEKFAQKYLSEPSKQLLKEWVILSKAIHHKAFHPESEAHQKFLKETIRKLEKLRRTLNVEEEILELKSKLKQ